MAAPVQSTSSKLEISALGRAAQHDDWIRDVGMRLGVLFLSPTENDLIKLLADRLRFRASCARPILDDTMVRLENRTEGFFTELRKLREVVDRSTAINFSDSTPTAETLYSTLEAEAEEMLAQQKQIDQEWKAYHDFLDSQNRVIANIPLLLRGMCRESGSNRLGLARELRSIFQNLFSVSQDVPPVAHLTYAWLLLQIGDSPEESVVALSAGARGVASFTSSQLCCRLLSEYYNEDGQTPRAFEWSKRALEHSSPCDANIEVALIAAQLHEPALARPFLEHALYHRPASIIGILADDRCIGLIGELLEIVVKVQTRLRREGRQHIVEWAKVSKEIADLQKTIGCELALSHELLEGHKTVDSRLQEADMITSGSLIRYCDTCRSELQQSVKNSLDREFNNKRDALTAARLAIDSVGIARENRLHVAKQENLLRLQNANAQSVALANKAKLVEKQCVLWFASGCGLFVLFLITKLILNGSGSEVDISSGMGLFLLSVAGIPIALSVVLQLYHGITRASGESQVREKVVDANRRMAQIELEANDVHREQLAVSRKNLADTEAQLKKIETAIRMSKGSTGENVTISPRLKIA